VNAPVYPCGDRSGRRRCWLYAGHRGAHVYLGVTAAANAGAPAKVCPRCSVAKSLGTAFQWRSNGTVFSWCKDCNRAYSKERRAARDALAAEEPR